MSDATSSPSLNDTEFPLSVILQQEQITRGPWTFPNWKVVGVVAGERVAGDHVDCQVIRAEDGREQLLWRGLVVRLFRDSAESYWYNLVGRQPSLFVICREDEEHGLRPCHITANYDEAGAYMETDEQVFATPLPPEVYLWLEHFVVEHVRPQAPKKRKRMNWTQESEQQHEARKRPLGGGL